MDKAELIGVEVSLLGGLVHQETDGVMSNHKPYNS
jgi:hypothetical protein